MLESWREQGDRMQRKQLHYYLVYQSPKDAAARLRIDKALSMLGCSKLHYSLWRVGRNDVKKALAATREHRPLIFKRSRELVSAHVNFERELYDLGSMAIIAYRLPKGQMGKRAAVIRALIRTPRIRIGQSLYLIPYLRASKLESYKGKVMLQDELFEFLKREGVDAHRLTYLRVVYPSSHKVLVKMMIDHEVLTCQKLTSALKELMKRINNAEPQELPRLRKTISTYNVRYRAIKGVIFFSHDMMRVDLRSHLKKTYSSLNLCKRMYRLKSTELLV